MGKGEKVVAYVMLIISAVFVVASFRIVPFQELTVSSSGGYAIFVSIICLIFALAGVFEKPMEPNSNAGKKVLDPVIVAFFIMLACYIIGIIYIHYVPATLLFLFAASFYLNRTSARRAILISYISTFMILLVFKYGFSVIMP